MKTKAEIINDTYSMLLMTGVTVNATPADMALALDRLENIMYELQAQGSNTGYNFEQVPDINSLSGLAMWMNQGVSCLLAARVAPDFGVTMTPELDRVISIASSKLSARLAQVNRTQYASRMPIGSGQRRAFPQQRFYGLSGVYPQTPDTLQAVMHEIKQYAVDFGEGQLKVGETVSSFTTEVTSGLLLTDSSNTDNLIVFTLTFNKGGAQRVLIKVIGDAGTTSIRSLLFNVVGSESVGAVNA